MKGIVFTEFIELVEDKFGFEAADEIIENSDYSFDSASRQARNRQVFGGGVCSVSF